MLDLEELQTVAQLIDNAKIILKKLEKAYSENESEAFNEAKKEILKINKNISGVIK